jgi:hypothetical protein
MPAATSTFPRRAFLGLGAAAGLLREPRWARGAAPPRARAAILLYMEGGPSQLDTFDPKPGRPTGGPFSTIATTISGLRISEHLPRLARQMKRLCLIRSLTSKEGNHQRARHLLHTGHPPQGGVDHPAFGSLVAEARGASDLPGYVALGGPGQDAGFLGAAYAPLPILNPSKPARNLKLARGVDEQRFGARLAFWRQLQGAFAARQPETVVGDQTAVAEQAVALMRSPGAAAFDLGAEPEAVRQAYGDGIFGAGCLMARRLVAQGVPFVEVLLRGWDTHEDNFPRVKALAATLDRGMSALLDDLAGRGLLESTLVIWLGDFGRTPRINERGGRDHFPAVGAALLAGGGTRGGEVVGATSADGDEITARPVTVPDLFRSIAVTLGVDPDRSWMSPSGRPTKTVDGGTLIPELFGK